MSFHHHTLPNGLNIIGEISPSARSVALGFFVRTGSRDENPEVSGVSHFLEHMVFKGTPRHPKVPKALQEHGAQFNGSTSDDRVNYFETLTATDENLEFAIDLEADRRHLQGGRPQRRRARTPPDVC